MQISQRESMAKLKTVDLTNKASGDVEIDDSITDTPYHKKVVSEVVRQFLAYINQIFLFYHLKKIDPYLKWILTLHLNFHH